MIFFSKLGTETLIRDRGGLQAPGRPNQRSAHMGLGMTRHPLHMKPLAAPDVSSTVNKPIFSSRVPERDVY
jgi:hypothetical protein